MLVGVVSHGSGCVEEGKPGIYAKIDYFKDWLETGKSGSDYVSLVKFIPVFIFTGVEYVDHSN